MNAPKTNWHSSSKYLVQVLWDSVSFNLTKSSSPTTGNSSVIKIFDTAWTYSYNNQNQYSSTGCPYIRHTPYKANHLTYIHIQYEHITLH